MTIDYFASNAHQVAYRNLADGVCAHQGLIVFSGARGSGKTLLLRCLIHTLSAHIHYAYCPSGDLDFDQLLDGICDDLELTPADSDRTDRLAAFKNFLKRCHERHEVVVLIIDQADQLPDVVFGYLLTLLQSLKEQRCLRLVLSGSALLRERLAQQRAMYSGIDQALFVSLSGLTEGEAALYVLQRLHTHQTVGIAFPPAAVARLHHYAQGVPGAIHALYERSVALAGDYAMDYVTVAVVDEAADAHPAHRPARGAVVPRRGAARGQPPARLRWLWAPALMGAGFCSVLASASMLYLYKQPDAGAKSAPVGDTLRLGAAVSPTDIADSAPVSRHSAASTPRIKPPSLSPRLSAPVPVAQQRRDYDASELAFWRGIKDSRNPAAYRAYLAVYPQGLFALIAKRKLQMHDPAPRRERVERLIARAWRAFDNKALTTPADDNAVKWAEAVLRLDPDNQEAKQVLAAVVEVYLGWSLRYFDRRPEAVALYLKKAQALQHYAEADKRAALAALDDSLRAQPPAAANPQGKRAKKTRPPQRGLPRTAQTRPSASVSSATLLHRVGRRLQGIGYRLGRKLKPSDGGALGFAQR